MAYKAVKRETTVAAAIGDAFAEFETLAGEMREQEENMSGANMEHLPKYEVVSTAADELENHDSNSEPDVPSFLADLKVEWHESVNKNKRRGPSRAIRLSNAHAMLEAAREVVDALEDLSEEKKDEADQLVRDLDEHIGFDVDFPTMYG